MSDFFGAVPKVVEKLERMERMANVSNDIASATYKRLGEIVVLLQAVFDLLDTGTEEDGNSE